MNDSDNSMNKIYFANYSRRIQAALLDGLFLLVIFICLIILASNVESQWIKVSMFLFVGLLFEPLLVSTTGASLGHHYKGLRVEKDGSGRNLNLFEAILRFFIKSILGAFSLVFFLTTKRHKALHDMAVNSVVVMSQASIKKGIEGVSERVTEEVGYKNASKLRRLLIIALYTFLVLIINGSIILMTNSRECIDHNQCTMLENVIASVSGFVVIGLFFIIVYFGWQSRLWGARRSKT